VTTNPPTDQQLNDIEERARAATVCPEGGEHTWSGSSFTHTQCSRCRFTRPRGERAEETAALVAELRHVQGQRRYLLGQLAKRDAETGAGDRALREFLTGEKQPDPRDALLRDVEAHLSALHGSVARHDNLAANLGCSGCELRDRIRAALKEA
jgi:ribosomal protein L37AE/L43A